MRIKPRAISQLVKFGRPRVVENMDNGAVIEYLRARIEVLESTCEELRLENARILDATNRSVRSLIDTFRF